MCLPYQNEGDWIDRCFPTKKIVKPGIAEMSDKPRCFCGHPKNHHVKGGTSFCVGHHEEGVHIPCKVRCKEYRPDLEDKGK